ncbi:MAG: N-(5'-phosphoribosyl)anthranilate isomerase [Candidatus Binatia bacterium]
MVKVKVCGITNIEDALRAVEFGADALGFNFYPPSPRYLCPRRAGAILTELPPNVCRIAVFVNEPRVKIKEILGHACQPGGVPGFSGVQFHGDEGQEECRGWSLKVIKAFRIRDPESLAGISRFPADFYLLDSWNPGFGGSGSPFLWSWIEGLDPGRLILSGGLNHENVKQAVQQVRPYGVDVCTGVEAKPGVKDHGKLKDFIFAAKAS